MEIIMNIAAIIVSFIVTFIPAMHLIILGISQYRSKKPVGFYTGEKPSVEEAFTDITAYNKKHGIAWILYGAGIVPAVMISVMMIEMTDEAPWICVALAEVVGGLLLLIRYHRYLEGKYVMRDGHSQ